MKGFESLLRHPANCRDSPASGLVVGQGHHPPAVVPVHVDGVGPLGEHDGFHAAVPREPPLAKDLAVRGDGLDGEVPAGGAAPIPPQDVAPVLGRPDPQGSPG